MLTLKGRKFPNLKVRFDGFALYDLEPNRREFDSYFELESFVRDLADPTSMPGVTVFFGQPWHHNIGHALFDGLYPAYVALTRFPPRHLQPFRLLASIERCEECWSEDIYSRFAGLGIIKHYILNSISTGRWFVFDELVMGSGTMCQRCTQPNLQLPGGVEMNGTRLFRDRMYAQHGVIAPIPLRKSNERRSPNDILYAYVIDNKRFSEADKNEIKSAIDELNNYTISHQNKSITNTSKLVWPLINVTYVYYDKVKVRNDTSPHFNSTRFDARIPTYELKENNFMAQLRLLRTMDIHITGPGTGQMYQTFLPDGTVSINLGGLLPWAQEQSRKAYASFLEQYMTSGTPYIKGLYYPINERRNGIHRSELVKLIRNAAKLIIDGFEIPVNPTENLAPDGQLFVELCEKDHYFCQYATSRQSNIHFNCLELWVEDLVHEHRQWQIGGFMDGATNISCPFNHSLLYELRQKYGIDHFDERTNRSTLLSKTAVSIIALRLEQVLHSNY
ncbi:unnamed protein product [Rotaria sp. Silwood1]|nr:unnamed protein product [Rotaria sp. Silwood1]